MEQIALKANTSKKLSLYSRYSAKGWNMSPFTPLSEMVANPMIKGLTLDRFRMHVGNMGLMDPKT